MNLPKFPLHMLHRGRTVQFLIIPIDKPKATVVIIN